MKLRSRLTISALALILLTMALVSFAFRQAYSSSFSAYLEENQAERLQSIVTDIQRIVRKHPFDLSQASLNDQLEVYARDTNINITVMDRNYNILALYQGLEPNRDGQIQVDQYQLRNEQGQILGSMLLTYDQTNPQIVSALKDFQSRTLGSLALGLSIFALVGLFFSNFFSRQITEPVEALSLATSKIRSHDFDIQLKDSNIDEIQKLSSNVQFLASTLEQQDQARKAYAQDISHELRTPLTNIQLHLEAIKDGVIPADAENIAILESNAGALLSLVERLKTSFYDASLSAKEEIQDQDLSALTEEILNAFEGRLRQKNALLLRQIPPGLHLETDPKLYRQILANLLSNALKALPEEEGKITVSLEKQGKHIQLLVQDNGVGIAASDLPHIFERFYRVDSSRNRKNGGQGLGLAISKNLVQQLKGKMEVTSKKGQGTTFRLTFPIHFF